MEKAFLFKLGISVGKPAFIEAKIIEFAKLRQSTAVFVANAHMLVEANQSKNFKKKFDRADIVTADGMPICIALRGIYGIKQERIAGMDLFPALLKAAASQNIKVYFYGSTNDVIECIKQKALNKYPKLKIVGQYAPPFRALTQKEEGQVIQTINSSGAGLVFVALGCPKQEIWISTMKGHINACMIGVGGAFPVFAGVQERAPLWMQKYALEWLYRLYQEPRRLWKRYFITNTLFIFYILIEMLKKVFKVY